jgi:hypothetical protein
MAIILTYNPKEWPYSEIERMEKEFAQQGHADEPWGSRGAANVGERAWLLRQGSEGHVIFGKGCLMTRPAKAPDRNGTLRNMATIRFQRFVDPRKRSLVGEAATRQILAN